MIIDERLIQNGITAELLAVLIQRHENMTQRFHELYNYYIGKHTILERTRASKKAANSKIVCNHAKYIVDIAKAYVVGNPVKYEAAKGVDIEPVKNAYLEQNIARIDGELIKQCGIYGRAYELIYSDQKSKPRSAFILPTQAFVVKNDDCTRFPLFGVYYYKTHDVNGNVTGIVCNVYDKEKAYTYEAAQDSWEALELTYETDHYFGEVPLIEHINNEERIGDFEPVITLIDAYNKLQSDRVDDKEDFVNAFLFVRGLDVDTETAKKLKQERILLGETDSDAKFLSKIMSEADVKILRDDLKEDIHRISMVPDLSDESFGGNQSGVAIRYKILNFEQMIKNKEECFATSLRKRFELYNYFFGIHSNMASVPSYEIDVKFTHNLPVNNLEIAQMINYLKDDLSLETKLSQLDFISDAAEEVQLVNDERDKRQQAAAQYAKPIQVNSDEE